MPAAVVLLLALGGLGCQNPASDLPPIPPVISAPAGQSPAYVPSENPAPSGVTTGVGWPGCDIDRSEEESFGRCVRDTFCSFFIGRDPDVPSARQIEAAYDSGRRGY